MNSIYDIREDEIDINGKAWNDAKVQQLAMKSLYFVRKMVDYWRPLLLRGEELFSRYEGNILSAEQIATYEDVEDKIVLQPPIMKSPIRSLVGHIIKSRRNGAVGTEMGDLEQPNDMTDELKLINILLSDMRDKTKEQLKVRDAIHEAFISCFPNVILWQKRLPTDDNPSHFTKVKLPWNSCVFGPININEPDMCDVTELVYYAKRSQADLELNFPDMVEQIRNHWKGKSPDDKALASLMGWESAETADYRDYLCSILQSADGDKTGPAGMLEVYQRIFQVRRKEEVFVSLFDDKVYEILPKDWSEKRRQAWITENQDKYAGPIEHECVTLWLTVFTASGLVLANEKHWFQESGMIPAEFYIPAIENGKPTGPAVDMSDDVLRNCVAQIEFLDDMRKGNGKLLITTEGAFADPEQITEESNKSLGIALLKQDFVKKFPDISKAFYEVTRNSSDAWGRYADLVKSGMYDNTRISESMQGQFAPRQADVAKKTEIEQSLVVNALYIDNYNAQWTRAQNLKLAMIPYMYDSDRIPIQGYDEESKEMMAATVNVPQYNMAGEVVGVINDVTFRKYFWKINAVDDSPTAKANMMQDALVILNSAVSLVQSDPSGKIFARFLMGVDNPILHQAGKMMMQDAEAKAQQSSALEQQKASMDMQAAILKAKTELEKARKAGTSISITGEQLAQYPGLVALYQALVSGIDETQLPPAQQEAPVAMAA